METQCWENPGDEKHFSQVAADAKSNLTNYA
jgi:hypothetical protein